MELSETVKGMSVLLIDDDPMVRDSMQIYFTGQGVNFNAAASAEEGLKDLELRTPEIIIIDYMLPGSDGLDFLKTIQLSHADAIKILITAYDSRKVEAEAIKSGAKGYIEKPLTIEKLQECLIPLLEVG
ncbi:response regulator [Acidobacteriota bacterium]